MTAPLQGNVTPNQFIQANHRISSLENFTMNDIIGMNFPFTGLDDHEKIVRKALNYNLGIWSIVAEKVTEATSANTNHAVIDTFVGDLNVLYIGTYADIVYGIIFADDNDNVIAKGYLGNNTSQKYTLSIITPPNATKLYINSRGAVPLWYKIDRNYELRQRILNAPAINEGFLEYAPGMQNTVFDDNTGIVCSFYTSGESWSESAGANKLSLFPINQPYSRIIKTIPVEIFNIFESNGLAVGNNLFRALGISNSKIQYIDYNLLTDSFSDVLDSHWSDGSLITREFIHSYLQNEGYTIDTTVTKWSLCCHIKGRVDASEKYLTLLSSANYAIACYTEDNGATIKPIAVIPLKVQAEADFVILGTKMYCLVRQTDIEGSVGIHFLTADYDSATHSCSNWSAPVLIDRSIDSRPSIEIYKDKLLICVECTDQPPFTSFQSASMSRNGVRFLYGIGDDANSFKEILYLPVKWSTTEQSLLINQNDIYFVYECGRNWVAINNGGTYGTGRGELVFAKIGEYYEHGIDASIV